MAASPDGGGGGGANSRSFVAFVRARGLGETPGVVRFFARANSKSVTNKIN